MKGCWVNAQHFVPLFIIAFENDAAVGIGFYMLVGMEIQQLVEDVLNATVREMILILLMFKLQTTSLS